MSCSPSSTRCPRPATYAGCSTWSTDAMVDTLAVRGTPEECAAELRRRFGDLADRVCCYFPGYDASLDDVADLAAALR